MTNYVALTLDLKDGSGSPITRGMALIQPTTLLTDSAEQMVVPQAPVQVPFGPAGLPVVNLLPTDDANVTPPGWAWQISFMGFPGAPQPYTFALPYASGSAQRLSAVTVVVNPVSYQAYLPLHALIVSASAPPSPHVGDVWIETY